MEKMAMNKMTMKRTRVIFIALVCSFLMVGCGSEGPSQTKGTNQKNLFSDPEDPLVNTEDAGSGKDQYNTGSDLAEYLGPEFDPETPYTYYNNGFLMITDKNGNLIVKENTVISDDVCPDKSAFCGNCRTVYRDDTGMLINKKGEILYKTNEAYIFRDILSNGRVVYNCSSQQHEWLIDEEGKELTDPESDLIAVSGSYYIERTKDFTKILYDGNGKVVYEADRKTEIGIKRWAELDDYYLWVKDRHGYSDSGEGDLTVYRLPGMEPVFTAQKVMDVNDFGVGVVFALVPRIVSNEARLVVIYDGKVTIDTKVKYDQRISAKGKFWLDRVIVDHDSYAWVYSTYDLNTGALISENEKNTKSGQDDEKLFDMQPPEIAVNNARAAVLGVDFTPRKEMGMNVRLNAVNADLFNYIEKHDGRRYFLYSHDNERKYIMDETGDEVLLSGMILYSYTPDAPYQTESVFAYGTEGDGPGRLVNLVTGRSLNVSGEYVGTQKVYAVFREENSYRVYNYDLDSFVIDENGEPHPDKSYNEMKRSEPEYEIRTEILDGTEESKEPGGDIYEYMSRWVGTYKLSDREYIHVIETYRDGMIYFEMSMVDASGESTFVNEYTSFLQQPDLNSFQIPYQSGVNEVFELKDGGIEVHLDNGMKGANDGFYVKEER